MTGMGASTFNSDFFMVAATVIPLLFIAIGVQRKFFVGPLETVSERFAHALQNKSKRFGEWLELILLCIILYVLDLLALIIVAAGLIGEVLALLALNSRSASSWTIDFVLASVLALAALPPVRFYGQTGKALLPANRAIARELRHQLHSSIPAHGQKQASPGTARAVGPSSRPHDGRAMDLVQDESMPDESGA
jgi:hypothetical protein